MDHLIGQRFSLISKSEIRYVGTLHEINAEQSTIALEEVYSFGTEDRTVDNFIPPSQQKFEYIVFRGSDVKDIKIAEEQQENKEKSPPAPPNDPAILNASRPGPPPGPPQPNRGESPFPPPGYPQQGQYGNYYPPPPGQFGRGYGPPPPHPGFGPGPGFPPYGPPPPGFFGPPGQGFPQAPNQFPQHPPPPAPIGPPGQRQTTPSQTGAPAPAPGQPPKPTQELPVEKAATGDGTKTPVVPSTGLPYAAVVQAKEGGISQPSNDAVQVAAKTAKATPTQPKSNRVTPAVPFTVNQKSFTPPVAPTDASAPAANGSTKQVPSQATMEEASRQAKEAVAAAMAKLNPQAAPSKPAMPGNAVDALAKKVSEMSTTQAPARGRGGYRGGRGARSTSGGQSRKIEIPKSDFDFESANAKFNKEDLIKEAIASGSPLNETPEGNANGETESNGTEPKRKDSIPLNSAAAYNKSSSFFDNISSEAKDREDHTDTRPNARVMRGQEFKKNIETFGQGNVDSGYRGRGRGRGFGGYRGGGNYRGYRGRGRGGANSAPAQS